MVNLIGHVSSGFTIIKQGKVAVLGERPNPYVENGVEYVAWHYKVDENGPNFFWGRYGNRKYAEKCFDKKEKGIYSGD